MDVNNQQNQSYWFVLDNVYNFTIQNPPITSQEPRYIVDTIDNRNILVNDTQAIVSGNNTQTCSKEPKIKVEENFWDQSKIKLLLAICLDEKFKNIAKDRTMWNKIASIVGTNPDECHKKYRNLKKTYIRLLKKKRMGKHVKWVHYGMCEQVFKECSVIPSSVLVSWDDNRVRKLISLYIENLNKFRDPFCLQRDIWKEIAAELGTTEYNCYHKFKNLKRTYFSWLLKYQETGKLIKWPYHSYFEKIFDNFKPARGAWDRSKISLLLQAYIQIADKFKNPKYLKKELWKDISGIVGESPASCDRKFRNLKQTYLRLKMRSIAGGSDSKWCYYKDFETICNNSLSGSNNFGLYKEENYIEQLLSFYIENKDKFKDRFMKKKLLWKAIALKLGLRPEECHKKFRNLKQTYIRLREKKLCTGKNCKWPYYSFFEKIFDDPKIEHNYKNDMDHTSLFEVKKVIRNMQKRDNDKFEKLVRVAEESNNIQRERNKILQALLLRK